MLLLWQLRPWRRACRWREELCSSPPPYSLEGGRSNKLLLEGGRDNKLSLGSNRHRAEALLLQWGKPSPSPTPPSQSVSRLKPASLHWWFSRASRSLPPPRAAVTGCSPPSLCEGGGTGSLALRRRCSLARSRRAVAASCNLFSFVIVTSPVSPPRRRPGELLFLSLPWGSVASPHPIQSSRPVGPLLHWLSSRASRS